MMLKDIREIENLQSHDNSEKRLYEKAVKIHETYWLEEDDETIATRRCFPIWVQIWRRRSCWFPLVDLTSAT
ncbi:hypothetical protein NC652_012508 [Populus alba x Populus x berolinensis]|nr:hypothetical protein NC652_012508 [Populus alba x Populus x berolinensis]